jgi:heme/copper-type cytochrome/quinol oxidase subunit 4
MIGLNEAKMMRNDTGDMSPTMSLALMAFGIFILVCIILVTIYLMANNDENGSETNADNAVIQAP